MINILLVVGLFTGLGLIMTQIKKVKQLVLTLIIFLIFFTKYLHRRRYFRALENFLREFVRRRFILRIFFQKRKGNNFIYDNFAQKRLYKGQNGINC